MIMKGNDKIAFFSVFVVLLILGSGTNVFARWRPTGSIQVFDNTLNRNVPVVGVEVRIRNWFKTWQGPTDTDGKFRSSKKFVGDVSCFLRWQYNSPFAHFKSEKINFAWRACNS